MFFLVLAHPDCPGQSPESHKMVVVVVVVVVVVPALINTSSTNRVKSNLLTLELCL